jgi:hypothetical protein
MTTTTTRIHKQQSAPTHPAAHHESTNNSQRPHTQQPTTPHWKAPYWTRKSPFELRLKPTTYMIALCFSVRVPHSVGIMYPIILWSPMLTTSPLRATLVP